MAVKLIDELQKEIKAAGEAVTQEAYLYQIPAFRHNTYFKDFAASEDLTHVPEDYWENVYYDIVVQETDWDTIWSQPTGREALSKDPAHKWKAEI